MLGHCRKFNCQCVLFKYKSFPIHHFVYRDKSVPITAASCKRGLLWYVLFSTNFSIFNRHTYLNGLLGYFHRSCNLVQIVNFLIYCSVFECGCVCVGGGGGLISNLNCPFAIYSCVMEKGYSCYISFFTNLALIYWTCLIGFGGKFHRSCNLAHTVRVLD